MQRAKQGTKLIYLLLEIFKQFLVNRKGNKSLEGKAKELNRRRVASTCGWRCQWVAVKVKNKRTLEGFELHVIEKGIDEERVTIIVTMTLSGLAQPQVLWDMVEVVVTIGELIFMP
ncbi:hypothetical protein VNO78_16969 [Psophocarpus tetragonolobus]|uniref:Uncharacterized protein n=1 Tax=Psophocarpus tetragonolobus TaxID=3891 RepID=A0AAN9XL38_PSOTE